MGRIDSSLWVKICGLMQPGQAVEIARLGADAIGMIGVRSSPRYVTSAQMGKVSAALMTQGEAAVERVGVFVNADPDTLQEAVDVGHLTTLQLHGEESPEACAGLRAAHPGVKLIKALRIRTSTDLENLSPYAETVDALLLDAYHPHLRGGTGQTLDWRSLTPFQTPIPWILAGGLTPDNVQQALTLLHPFGIDLSSGVETSPGNKSLEKVQRLFQALRDRPVSPVPES